MSVDLCGADQQCQQWEQVPDKQRSNAPVYTNATQNKSYKKVDELSILANTMLLTKQISFTREKGDVVGRFEGCWLFTRFGGLSDDKVEGWLPMQQASGSQ